MSRSARGGFTLMELLVILAIFAILIGLLLPAVRTVREPAARAKCQNNMKQVVLACHIYESAEGRLPPGCVGPETAPENRLSWMAALLPYLEKGDLHKRLDPEKGYQENAQNFSETSNPAVLARIGVFMCPTSSEASTKNGLTNYVAMAGVGLDAASRPEGAAGNGFMGYDRRTTVKMIEAADGIANTIALMETRSELGPWARGGPSTLRGFDPANFPLFGDDRLFAGHNKAWHAAMVDGSVRSISASIDPKKLAAAITIAGGEPFDLD